MIVLLVEDTETAIKTCNEYAQKYTESGKKISIIVARTVADAFDKLSCKIDVAIVDIKLKSEKNGGNDVVSKMQELCLRIPTVFHTGTPDDVQVENVLKVFTRGDGYPKIFDYLLEVYNTGITEILGKHGFLEEQINNFYNSVFWVTRDSWISKGKEYSAEVVKKSLLRTVIYHLENILENNSEKTFYEEFYLCCSNDDLHTGSIIKRKEDNKNYIVISPACDLVKRPGGNRNTNIITLCEIDPIELHGFMLKTDSDDQLGKDKKNIIKNLLANTKNRYHWIPKIDSFSGGLLDFTKTISMTESKINELYDLLNIRISPPYLKNILSRFSSYYARQGQPDLDVDAFVERLKPVSKEDSK